MILNLPFLTFITLALSIPLIQAWKAAILTDIHVDPLYQANITEATICNLKTKDQTVYTDQLAPYGRIGCDPPIETIELILKRISQKEQGLDLLFMPGDFIGHSVPINQKGPFNPDNYKQLKELHTQISLLLRKYLPNVLIIPTLGNNDFVFHYQSPFGEYRSEFYSFLSQNWFANQPQMVNRPDLNAINDTFMNGGGYYKVKLNDNITVLALNTLMFNINSEFSNDNLTEINGQLDWLEAEMQQGSIDGTKFILTFHIYAGSFLNVKPENGEVWNQWKSNYTLRYAKIIRQYHSSIILEVTGHDHISDLRYSDQTYSNETGGTNYSFHNIIIAPSLTMTSNSLPGYTIFNLDEKTLTPNSLKLTFLPINQTIGPSAKILQPTFRVFDYQYFGISDLTVDSMNRLKGKLKNDQATFLEYIVMKRGFDPQDPVEFEQAIQLYFNKGQSPILKADMKPDHYLCQISANLVPGELQNCIDSIPKQSKDFDNYQQFLY